MGNNGKLNEKERQFLDDYFGKTQTMMFEHAKQLVGYYDLPSHLVHDLVQVGYMELGIKLATDHQYAGFVKKIIFAGNGFTIIDAYVKNVMDIMAYSLKRDYANCASVEQDFPDRALNLTFGQSLLNDVLMQIPGEGMYEDRDDSLGQSDVHLEMMLGEQSFDDGEKDVSGTEVAILSTQLVGLRDEQYQLHFKRAKDGVKYQGMNGHIKIEVRQR